MIYKYLIGGITIASDIYFPEMIRSYRDADVQLMYGDVPEHLVNNEVDFPFIEANENQYLLKLPNVARYLVENGDKITIQPEKDALAADVNNYVLTAIFGVLSYQRGYLPMHGGVFLLNGKAIMITGMSGYGKSALLAALYKRGYPVIADDISNISITDGKAIVYPGFPRIMMWKDTLVKLNIDLGQVYKLRSDLEKYFFKIDEAHFEEPVVLSQIYVLTDDVVEKENSSLKGLSKIEALKQNIFHPWMADVFDKQHNYSRKILMLASIIKVDKFGNDRSRKLDKLTDLFIENLLADAE
jgi:hypothetical protein